MQRKLNYLVILLGIVGLVDSAYLTYEHFQTNTLGCPIFGGCNEVLRSQYSEILRIPTSLLGVIYYLTLIFVSILILFKKADLLKLLVLITFFGFLFSMWLVYLQLFVIKNICAYCLFSALLSTLIFIITFIHYQRQKPHSEIVENKTKLL